MSRREVEEDFLLWLLGRVQALQPEFTAAMSQAVEAEVRATYGGQDVRILKRRRDPAEHHQRLQAINGMLRERVGVSEIAREMGLGRATIYRALGKKAGHGGTG